MNELLWIVLLLIGIFGGVFVCSLVIAILYMISGLIFGLEIWNVRILFWEILKELIPGGKYSVRTNKCRLVTSVIMGKNGMTQKQDHRTVLLTTLLYTVLTAAYVVITILTIEGDYSRLSFGQKLMQNFCIMAVFYWGVYVFGMMWALNHAGLRDLYNQKIKEMQATGKISGVYLPPLEQLNYKSSEADKCKYQTIRLLQAIHVGDIYTMVSIANWGENNPMLVKDAGICIHLVFYYSYYCQNHPGAAAMARKYYNMIKVELEKGTDSNDKRIYAYYMYYVEHNPAEAKKAAIEGIRLLPKFPTDIPEIVEGEEKWLNHLLEEINRNACYHY